MNVVSIAIAVCVGFFIGLLTGRSSRKQEDKPMRAKPVAAKGTVNKKAIANVYVGNLSPDVSEKDLRETFEVFGVVQAATIIKDRSRGGHKRFAFVEMVKPEEAQAAIKALDGRDLKGRTLKVKEAHNRGAGTRPARPRGGARRNSKRKPDRRPQVSREAS